MLLLVLWSSPTFYLCRLLDSVENPGCWVISTSIKYRNENIHFSRWNARCYFIHPLPASPVSMSFNHSSPDRSIYRNASLIFKISKINYTKHNVRELHISCVQCKRKYSHFTVFALYSLEYSPSLSSSNATALTYCQNIVLGRHNV